MQRILEGSVRKAGNKVRITAQLINAADEYHIWSESYERHLEDIFEVQDDISRTNANKLRKNLSSADHETNLVSIPTENMEAYKMYMQGIHYRGRQTIESDLKSMQCFNAALAIAPELINPNFYVVELNAFFADAGVLSTAEAAHNCGEATSRAMHKDPDNAWSQLTAGINAFYFEWNIKKANHHLETAITLNPNLSMAYLFLSRCRLVMQQKDEIDELLQKAYHLDPMGGMTGAAGEISFLAGKFDLAIEYCNEALAIDPNNAYATAFKAFAIGFQGDWNMAVDMLLQIYEIAPDFNFAITFHAYARSGQTEKAHGLISRLEEKQQNPESPPLHHLLALLYLAIGDKEQFYDYFETGLKGRAILTLIYFSSPLLSEVRNEQRLSDLGRKNGLPV